MKINNEIAVIKFEKLGWRIIGEYKNTHTPCLCECLTCGFEKEVVLHNNHGVCKNCKDLEIINCFKDNNCILLSKPNRSVSMDYICSCGNKSRIKWFNFKSGERCRKCAILKTKKNNTKRISVEQNIHEYFVQQKCVLLEDKYINQSTKMRYICSCGNESLITWKGFQRGHRCSLCAKNKIKQKFVPYGSFHSNWNSNRDQVLLNKKIRSKAKGALKSTLRSTNKHKTSKTFEMLGYSKKDLIDRIINHPNWNRVKDGDWELDHIFPVKAFLDFNIIDIKIINMLDNLQPLEKELNRAKNSKYDEKLFKEWLISYGIELKDH